MGLLASVQYSSTQSTYNSVDHCIFQSMSVIPCCLLQNKIQHIIIKENMTAKLVRPKEVGRSEEERSRLIMYNYFCALY